MPGEQLEFGDDERSIAFKRAWDRALHALASKVNKATFESYIRPIRPLLFQDRQVTLGVASAFAREWLVGKHYVATIQTVLEEILGRPLEIRLTVYRPEDRPLFGEAARIPAVEAEPSSARATGLGATASAHSSDLSPIEIPSLPFNDEYTFDTFVIGKSNRLAQAGAAAVADSPGAVYNPLFIYGGPGLGKTHLLHAIGHAAKARGCRLRVSLVDGENFTQNYVTALRERRTEEFRRFYRSVDIWLVDDIQFIAGKEQTKEEFFHTFNALYQLGKQIVISSDRSPRELRAMDERLRSRFECGLIADINPPELETRVAILERRCAQKTWDVPKDVVFYIASAIQSNIRALEGALTRLVAYASIMGAPISIDLAQSVLGEYFIEKPTPSRMQKGISVETILRAVAEHFQTSVEALRSQRRDREVATARQVAMFLCREMTEVGLAQIGAAIGGRDHTTVQRAITKVETLLDYDPVTQRNVQEISRKLDN